MLFECDFGFVIQAAKRVLREGARGNSQPSDGEDLTQSVFFRFPHEEPRKLFFLGAPRSRHNRGEQSGAVCGVPWNINDVASLQFTREHLFSNYTLALSTAVGSPLNQELNISRKLLFMLNIYVQVLFCFILFFPLFI